MISVLLIRRRPNRLAAIFTNVVDNREWILGEKVMFRTSFFVQGTVPFVQSGSAAEQHIRRLHPKIRGFVQTHATQEQIGNAAPAFAGVAELWFDTPELALAACKAGYPLQGLVSAGTQIVCRSVGLDRSVMILPNHRRGQGIKGVFPFGKKTGISVANFQAHWWLNHGPIAALTEGATAYVQNHPMPSLYASIQPDFDGITEIWWPNVAIARAAMSSRQMTVDQSTDAQNFAEPGSVKLFLAREEVIIAP